jgi:ORF6N domain
MSRSLEMANAIIERLLAAPLEYGGQRVITLPIVDELYQRLPGTAGRTFRQHKTKLVQGEHYFEVLLRGLPKEMIDNPSFAPPSAGAHSGRRRAVILVTALGYGVMDRVF